MPKAHPDDAAALKRQRTQCFKLFYQAYYEWQALRFNGQTVQDTFIAPNGEEIYMLDLLIGYDYLPPRQQQSFELICMRSHTEAAATIEIYGDGDRSSTVVQQYAQLALERMIECYDQVQSGTWDPLAIMKTRKLNGKEIRHDALAARRHRLQAGSTGRRDPGQVEGDADDGRGEEGAADPRHREAATGT